MWKEMDTCGQRCCACGKKCEYIERCANEKRKFTYGKEMCECEKRCLYLKRDVYMWKEMCECLEKYMNLKGYA